MSLFDEEADENDDATAAALTGQLAVNKNYAERYNNWRGKEEMQKCTLLSVPFVTLLAVDDSRLR